MPSILLLYWGRRGSGGRLILDLAQAAQHDPQNTVTVSVSDSNELLEQYHIFTPRLHVAHTFNHAIGALSLWRIIRLRREIEHLIREHHVTAVVTVMSHVWSAFVAPIVRRAHIPYLVVVHDALPHAGDRTGFVNRWLLRDAKQADTVITLSRHVEKTLVESAMLTRSKIVRLFHPLLPYGGSPQKPGARPRFLFFGRLLRYKGLGMFVAALETLRQEGLACDAGIFGEGDITAVAGRLQTLGVEVVNRWITEGEIAAIFGRFDVSVASYIEASQSGVVALSLGNGVPVIVTPVGGLTEQIIDGETGLIAGAATADALASSMRRVIIEAGLLPHLKEATLAHVLDNSAQDFIDHLLTVLRDESPDRPVTTS